MASKLISFVMPVLNEEKYLERAVRSVFEQELPVGYSAEFIVALGPSTDRTNQVAKRLQEQFADLVLVDNPAGTTSVGLNLAINKSRGEIVVRVDAHSQLTAGYVKQAVEILESNKDLGNVGGQMLAEGETNFEKAVAWAYKSPYGLGAAKFHVGGEAGAVDTVYLGVFRKSALLEAGLFDESVIRGQDWELNQRIRGKGYTIWFDPRLKVVYRPRSNLLALAKQFFKTGVWRGKLSRDDFPRISLRYLAPPTLVIGSVLYLPGQIYILVVLFVAFTAANLSARGKLWLVAVLPTMHYLWGIGFILGFLFPSIAKDV